MAKKLPKHIAEMVKKNNLVLAIKTLSNEESLSFDEAKAHIDDFEAELKQKQLKSQQEIVQKQNSTISAKANQQDLNPPTTSTTTNIVDPELKKVQKKQEVQKSILPFWFWQVVFVVFIIIIILFGLIFMIYQVST